MAAVEDFINEGAVPAERMIRDLVSCEHSYINTDHPQFIGGSRAIALVMDRRQQVLPVVLPLPPFPQRLELRTQQATDQAHTMGPGM